MDGRNKRSLSLVTAFLLCAFLSAGTVPRAFAEDDLPAPGSGEEVPVAEPSAQEALPDFGASDSLGDAAIPAGDALPEAVGNPAKESNQVNRTAENDDIFLPTPNVQDNVNYTPLGSPISSRTTLGDSDWRIGMNNRPAFSLQLGGAMRNYGTDLVPGNVPGGSVAASWRVLNIAQTVFLHAYVSGTFFKVGDVAAYPNVMDFTLHVGPMVEVGIGRRLSLYGSLLRRSNTVTAGDSPYKNSAMLDYVDEPSAFQLGFGAQWDFYVVPHGSLGARVHVERDMAMFYLTMAIEPAPRKKLSLNFNSGN